MSDVLRDWLKDLHRLHNEHCARQDEANADLSSMTFVLFMWTMAMHGVSSDKAVRLMREFEADLERFKTAGDDVPDSELFTEEAEDRFFTKMLEGIAMRIEGRLSHDH